MDEAKKYHLRPECRIEMQNERTRARLGAGQVLYILGGFGNSQTPVDAVERYDSRTEKSTLVQVKRKAEKMVEPSKSSNFVNWDEVTEITDTNTCFLFFYVNILFPQNLLFNQLLLGLVSKEIVGQNSNI